MLLCAAHPVVEGWLNRVIGWIETKLEELARYAVDPSSGGGLQSVDYLVLQLLNRQIPVLMHFQQSGYVHPERLYEELLRLAGELATFATSERRARDYPAYDHDDLENVFAPLMRDIQDFLSARLGRRAIRLEIIERAQNAFVSPIRDRSLFRNATLVLEVAARRPLVEIQNDFPHLFKVGPNTKMNEIVHANLPGVPLVHLPTPPPHIRAITDHVYFYLDRKSPLWPEFSNAGIDRDALLGRLAGTRTASMGDSGRPADERQGQTGKSVRSRSSGRSSVPIRAEGCRKRLTLIRRRPTPGRAAARAVFADAGVDQPVLCLFAAAARLCAAPPTSPPPEEWISTPATPLPPPLAEPAGTDAACRRTGGAQRQSDHARGRTAAAAARAACGWR